VQSCQELLPPLSMGEQGGGGGRSGPNCRRHGGLEAQVSHEIERGDRGGLKDVLTGGGEEQGRPVLRSMPAAGFGAGGSSTCAGRRRGTAGRRRRRQV
jgi:hypothetical protein